MAGNFGVAGNSSASARTSLPGSIAPATTAGTRQDPPPATGLKVRKPRKKREPNVSTTESEKKERAPRKPRGASSATTNSRKKPKVEQLDDNNTIDLSRPASAGLQASTLVQPVSFTNSPHLNATETRNEAAKTAESGVSMQDPAMSHTNIPSRQPYDYNRDGPKPPPPTSTTARSTAMYDPIRSMTIARIVDPPPPASSPQVLHTPPRPTYNPSMSPAISGIIDPPAQSSFAQSPTALPPSPSTAHAQPQPNGQANNLPPINGHLSSMDIDSVPIEQASKKIIKKVPSEVPTRAGSPKPTRAKEQPPPPPPGSGLLSASLFGGDSSMDSTVKDGGKAPSIVLHVDLKESNNRVISFGRLAEEKYGFAALYPRQAAQKERLAKVAAAGAALERSASGSKFGGTSAGESGDEDLSVDIERDSDADGDIAMSGINGGLETTNSGTDAPGPKRRRRRKQEEYDQDDPFVDDSELLWEAQAAASKDGFFVYCGPLVPEGEKPAVERADGTIKRGRGRGRGGGPGSRGGRGGAGAAEGGSGRGGGAGSRGGGTTRKPRITKAERAQREQEKLAREKMAPILAKPSAYPS
ncbi:uncharacterized protein A1O9_10059 [Exophiala aquamarina CBS 119918]|uniref:Hpc2-related domain-containing protein n=1 Tax=Exophiala aquamarina CBS 119918 TaxID=1182545 RepID=A0A072P0J3_9EURO|nr:uncharacterized protein A1O9_10059 [Exophiala aquamarina CBS 119918]KEF53659.1 hypothetical protein A1O9_10059 [Exophiala aquamarina CBS 119918]